MVVGFPDRDVHVPLKASVIPKPAIVVGLPVISFHVPVKLVLCPIKKI
jgi:hypothetical protein